MHFTHPPAGHRGRRRPVSRLSCPPFGRALLLAAGLGLPLVGCASPPPEGTYEDGDDDDGSDDGSSGTPDPDSCTAALEAPSQPFAGHAVAYAQGSILPSAPAEQRDQAVRDFYDTWKERYLAEEGCGEGQVYVASNTDDAILSVSEAHGYGMLILAYMAGHDPDAKRLFDGMYAYFRAHPTESDRDLMAWAQNHSCVDSEGKDSASDGDLDIAYALLLADKQWGSGGAIDYGTTGRRVVAAIREGDLDSTGAYVLLGNWVTPRETNYYRSTRTSDFMPGHFATFFAVTGDEQWNTLLDREYEMVDALQTTYAADTGLLPDFVVDPNTDMLAPAEPNFLENKTDGEYGYNACRDPWRIALHYFATGDARAKTALERMNAWVKSSTGGDPNKIMAGYDLGGNRVRDYPSRAFTAPFGVGAMVDASHQEWLDGLWAILADRDDNTYFSDTLQLLSLIAMSGNWWAPEAVQCPAP